MLHNLFENARDIIIVEDEPLISIMIEDMAQGLGWIVAGCAYNADQALALVHTAKPSLALLDIELGRGTSLDVAAACRERGIPVLFVTGYTARDLPSECGDTPVLAKPFSAEQLSRAMGRCVPAVAYH